MIIDSVGFDIGEEDSAGLEKGDGGLWEEESVSGITSSAVEYSTAMLFIDVKEVVCPACTMSSVFDMECAEFVDAESRASVGFKVAFISELVNCPFVGNDPNLLVSSEVLTELVNANESTFLVDRKSVV